MKLLFDHNLSHRLVRRLADLFPGSQQTRLLGFERTDDRRLSEFAKVQGFTVVTLDKDFSDLALLLGEPPKVIWLRCGNSTVSEVENLLRMNFNAIEQFHQSPHNAVLEIWP